MALRIWTVVVLLLLQVQTLSASSNSLLQSPEQEGTQGGDDVAVQAYEGENFSHATFHGDPRAPNDDAGRLTSRGRDRSKCERAGYGPESSDAYAHHVHWDWGGSDRKSPPKCKSATTNARGTYTSRHAPCVLTFHRIPEAPEPKRNALSDACADSNVSPDHPDELEYYVALWPDECVGDYPRCYRTAEDEKYLLRFLCGHPELEVPNGTTHVRVNCTHDSELRRSGAAEREMDGPDSYNIHAARRHRELLAALLAGLALCLAFVATLAISTYRYAVRPYLAALMGPVKRSRSDPELSKLVATEAEHRTANPEAAVPASEA